MGGISTLSLFILLALLVVPAWALWRLAPVIDQRFLFGYPILISAVTYACYWHDKRRAQSGGWRTPESTLHLCELLGGWPGAFLGQRDFRHKVAKTSYQFMFWAIIALHQFVAWEFIWGWPISRKTLSLLPT